MRHTLIILFAFVAIATSAQIDNRLHWYDGAIVYSAENIEGGSVLMNAMDEGEEHEFVLRYSKEVTPGQQIYTVANGNPNMVNEYDAGTTVRQQKTEGWDVICFYDSENRLKSVLSGESEWDAQKLNAARWRNQILGEYAVEGKRFTWSWESLSINQISYPYEIITFNGRVTGFITIKPVDGARNELEGTWEVVPTLEGITLYSVDTESDGAPWGWKRSGKEHRLAWSNPGVGRFFYASTTLLNDRQFRRFDKPTLRIMRNAILARHGYRFQSDDLNSYFGSQAWYKPAESNDNIKLSFVEQLNIDLIKYVEAKE